MWSVVKTLAIAALLSVGVACQSGRYSTAAFHLPADGNPERGGRAFLELGCNSCHSVTGTNLPAPSAHPPWLSLGGEVDYRLSDAYLVTSIIDPTRELALSESARKTGVSRMTTYADTITARQMIDIVAFLQAHYVVRERPAYSLTN